MYEEKEEDDDKTIFEKIDEWVDNNKNSLTDMLWNTKKQEFVALRWFYHICQKKGPSYPIFGEEPQTHEIYPSVSNDLVGSSLTDKTRNPFESDEPMMQSYGSELFVSDLRR